MLYRDADGKPITEEVKALNEDGTPVVPEVALDCVLPVASYAVDPANPDPNTELLHLVVSIDGPEPKCELTEEDLPYVMEVDFGRLNLVRSPSKVLQKAYDAAMTTLASGTGITTDPAGRLAAMLADGTVQVIDSPLENVALYLQMMTNADGTLTTTDGTTVITLPDDLVGYPTTNPLPDSWLDIAAALFAAGADKTGIIDVDEVVYINEFLGLNAGGYDHYTGYSYDRQNRYGSVEADLLLPTLGNPTTYEKQTVSIMDYVFDSYEPSSGLAPGSGVNATGSNVAGFARAADDALQVIEFIHDYALP